MGDTHSKFVLLFLALTSITCRSREDLHWVDWKSPNDEIAVSLPESYQTWVEDENNEFGLQRVQHVGWHTAEFIVNNMRLKTIDISWVNLPDSVKSVSPELLMQRSARWYIRERVPPLIRYMIPLRPFSQAGVKGIEFSAEVGKGKDNGYLIYCRKYVIHDKLYTIYLGTYKNPKSRPYVERFFKSIKVGS